MEYKSIIDMKHFLNFPKTHRNFIAKRWSTGSPLAHKHYKLLCYIGYPLTACIPGIRHACNIEIEHIQSWGDNNKLMSHVTA